MGTDDPGRAGAPPGPDQARGGLRPRRPRQPGGHRQEPRGRPGLAGRGRDESAEPRRAGLDLAALVADIDDRLADLAAHPTGADAGAAGPATGVPDEPARSHPRRSTSPRPSAGSARIRTGRSCSTSARPTSSRRSGRPARAAHPDVGVPGARRRGARPTGPLMVICHIGGRSAAVTGFLMRGGRDGRGQRRGRDGGLGAGRAAGPRAARRTRARASSRLTSGAARAAGARRANDGRAACALWANAQPMRIRMTKLTRAGAGRVEVAELLADLAADRQARARSRRPGRAGRTAPAGRCSPG